MVIRYHSSRLKPKRKIRGENIAAGSCSKRGLCGDVSGLPTCERVSTDGRDFYGSSVYTSSPFIRSHTKLVLLRLETEFAKSPKEGTTADMMSVSWLLSSKTFTCCSGMGGSRCDTESSGKSVMSSRSSDGASGSWLVSLSGIVGTWLTGRCE